jgi:hypothetical protein
MAFRACLLGVLSGALMFVPLTCLDWTSSGPDSGPPTESFHTLHGEPPTRFGSSECASTIGRLRRVLFLNRWPEFDR